MLKYFYPRPPRGGRTVKIFIFHQFFSDFYPRPSARRANGAVYHHSKNSDRFLSTPSARRATYIILMEIGSILISIHALREEGDRSRRSREKLPKNFYPRPPRGGRLNITITINCYWYFYPRPPRGGRLGALKKIKDYLDISIHALREEGDRRLSRLKKSRAIFLSTPSARRATNRYCCT